MSININNLNKKQKNLLLRVIAAAVMLVVLFLLPLEEYPALRFVLFMVPYLTVGYDVLRKAWKGILNHQVFDECFLMAVATIGAMILGEYTEAVAVSRIPEAVNQCLLCRITVNIGNLILGLALLNKLSKLCLQECRI